MRKLKPSLLRNLHIASIAFGAMVGMVFPFYAEFFVLWKPGMYAWFFIGCVIAGVTIGVVNFALVKIILLKKLQQVAVIASEISNKDIRHRCEIQSDDLIGEIITSFNQMSQALRDMIGKINKEATQLHASSDELKTLTSSAVFESQQQQSQIEQVAAAVNQMASTAQEVAQHADQTASAIKESDDQGESAKVVVIESKSAVAALANIVADASDVINNLEHESENIGNVLTVINSIAEQTNLLALNAAIEAARAGEQGRGFAVVADEVRTLATRTQESTKEISSMIDRLQSGSHDAVTTMNQGRSQAQQGVQFTEQAVTALGVIASNISTIKGMSSQIASAAEEQNAVVDDVNQNVLRINEVSMKTSTNMTKVKVASNDVAQNAADLQALVRDYKI